MIWIIIGSVCGLFLLLLLSLVLYFLWIFEAGWWDPRKKKKADTILLDNTGKSDYGLDANMESTKYRRPV